MVLIYVRPIPYTITKHDFPYFTGRHCQGQRRSFPLWKSRGKHRELAGAFYVLHNNPDELISEEADPSLPAYFPTLLEKSATWNPFCPVFRTLGGKGSQKGSLHVQEPKKVPYITKNGSKQRKKVLNMVLKTHLEPFREPFKVPPVGQQKNPFF